MVNKKRIPDYKKKTHLVGFLADVQEKKEIKRRAKAEGLNVSDYIRKALFAE